MASFTPVLFGETTAVRCQCRNNDGDTFTLASATVHILKPDGTTYIRDGVAASVDNTSSPRRAYYTETFSAANGYEEGGVYTVTFSVVTSDGYTLKVEGALRVRAVADA